MSDTAPGRFGDLMGAEPTIAYPARPTAEQIQATGEALPPGDHTLTTAQQKAWFGGDVFAGAVRWEDDAFVLGGQTFSPIQVYRAVQSGKRLGAKR